MTDARFHIPDVAGRNYAVFGLARSGMAAAKALAANGARVWAWDDNTASHGKATAAGIPLVDLYNCDWAQVSELVLSPGIPHTFPKPHPVAALAQQHDCPIIGDMELLARAGTNARFAGITGTNGKSTTTSLIGHILKQAGLSTEVGGNLGTAALDLKPLDAKGIYVLEMSSYQLELTTSLVFDVAILLNITPDHLDRHGGMDGYVASKLRIFDRQRAGQAAIVAVDDEYCRGIHARLGALKQQQVVPISVVGRAKGGVYAESGKLIDDMADSARTVMTLAEAPRLPGSHNWQNIAAAYAACRALGVTPELIVAGIKSFPGLAHRQELIATIGDVAYVNDSKATNADATAKALGCYQPIYWILGGKAKETGLDGLEPYYPRIAHGFLIGEATERFAAALQGRVAVSKCGTLDAAVKAAHALAQREAKSGAVVLLSPACASFDQFANFEERGEAFRRAVLALQSPSATAAGGAR
ncbi:MAG TPA: UDP-N-acetylmuramoyl-L-alanine--D-glutamate ligase [Dongiaceae bacterium]